MAGNTVLYYLIKRNAGISPLNVYTNLRFKYQNSHGFHGTKQHFEFDQEVHFCLFQKGGGGGGGRSRGPCPLFPAKVPLCFLVPKSTVSILLSPVRKNVRKTAFFPVLSALLSLHVFPCSQELFDHVLSLVP